MLSSMIPKKLAPDVIGGGTGFRKRSCSAKKLERDDDSRKSHLALRCECDALLEVAAVPAHPHHRAPLRKGAVLEIELGAGALQQCLGDEEAQAQPARLVPG